MRGRRREPQAERVIPDRERARRRTMERAARLLAAKPRSIEELRQRLLEKSWTDDEIVAAVIERLKEYGYLDDDQFADNVVRSQLRQRPQGRRRIEQTMAAKKLKRETISSAIDRAFDELPEASLIDIAIERRLAIKGRPESRDDLRRFCDHLARRGFSYSLIRERLAAVSNGEFFIADGDLAA